MNKQATAVEIPGIKANTKSPLHRKQFYNQPKQTANVSLLDGNPAEK